MRWNRATVKDFPELSDLRRIVKNNDACVGFLILIDKDEISVLRQINKGGLTKKADELIELIYSYFHTNLKNHD